ncbi:MAG: DsbA family protein [Devosiaceae bacterium]|nr:DsbA family protein [Devosiaceae bacterium]
MNITRRNALILTAAASTAGMVGLSTRAFSAEGDFYDVESLMNPTGWTDREILGATDAKATMIEYSSPTCPFCASFHAQTLPEVKTQLIETGKTRYILRPFVRNVLDAVVFMLADAAGEGYHDVVSTYMKTQAEWSRSDTPRDDLLAIALQLGFTEESFENALTNQELFAGMEAARDQARNEFDLTGTPTFYVNGKMLSGNKTLADITAEIEAVQG